jgi:hypothetical protein
MNKTTVTINTPANIGDRFHKNIPPKRMPDTNTEIPFTSQQLPDASQRGTLPSRSPVSRWSRDG